MRVILFVIGNFLQCLLCYSIKFWLAVNYSVNSTAKRPRRQLNTSTCRMLIGVAFNLPIQLNVATKFAGRFDSRLLNALSRFCFSQWHWHKMLMRCSIMYFKYFPPKNIYQVGCVSHVFVFWSHVGNGSSKRSASNRPEARRYAVLYRFCRIRSCHHVLRLLLTRHQIHGEC